MKPDKLTIADLKPAPYNPQKINDKQSKGLSKSINTFGNIADITFNQRSGLLVTGHKRFAKIKDKAKIENLRSASDDVGTIGYADIICDDGKIFTLRIVDWDEKIEIAANVSANNKHIEGEYDATLLNEALSKISDSPDFNDLNLNDLLMEFGYKESSEIEFDEIGFEDGKEGKTTINVTCLKKDKDKIINELKQIGKNYEGFGIYF
jgi:hypothetical protein